VTDTSVDVLVDRSRRLAVIDPDGREALVSIGAAVFNLRVALGAARYRTAVLRLPTDDREVAARVTAAGTARRTSKAASALTAAIPGRHTNRRPFADRPIPFETMEELRSAAATEGVTLLKVVRGLAMTRWRPPAGR
jgi:hypothetical protein